MDLSNWAMASATILKTILDDFVVKIMKKMGKYLNLNKNLLCDDLGDNQSAKWALATMLRP